MAGNLVFGASHLFTSLLHTYVIGLNKAWGNIKKIIMHQIYRPGAIHHEPQIYIGTTATTSASFGEGSGPIALNRVDCIGNELKLMDCPSGAITSCTHAHDAGVQCSVQIGMYVHITYYIFIVKFP